MAADEKMEDGESLNIFSGTATGSGVLSYNNGSGVEMMSCASATEQVWIGANDMRM